MSITINGSTSTITAASGLTIAGNTAITGSLSATGITSVADVTEATSTTAASLKTAGGLAVAKKLHVGTLLDLSAATAGQIKFPATQNASADANTLDDYAEGTFTITASTGLTTTPSAVAGYTKIGNAVTLSIPTLSGTSNAVNFVLTGIPAAIRADAPAGQLFPVRVSDNGAASVWGLGFVSNNGSLYLYKNIDGGNDWTASGTKSVSFCTVHYMTKVS